VLLDEFIAHVTREKEAQERLAAMEREKRKVPQKRPTRSTCRMKEPY
jgi:hypothetical protein